MPALLERRTTDESVADLLKRLGGISPRRIRLWPPLGTATARDVNRIRVHEKRLYELIDGVLVEKVMGAMESSLALVIAQFLLNFLDDHDLGIVLGADGTLRFRIGLVRIPDVSFISWDRLPSRTLPTQPIPHLIPNLAVEVLSKGNTKREMDRKLRDFFEAGVELVWFVRPRLKVVDVYTAPDEYRRVRKDETLEGGDVLPGFKLPLARLFARVK